MSRSCTRSGHRGQSVNGRFRSRNSGQLVDHNILGVAWISRRLSAVVVPVRGDAVRAVRPALRGRSAATRLEGVEHTATMSGPTAFCVGTTSGVRRRLKIPRLLAGANTREPTAASSQPKGCAPTPRDAGHAGRAWCDRARTGRDPASRRSTSRSLQSAAGAGEDEPERQRGFDGEIGILQLPATFADAHGLPSGDRIRGQPHGDIASLDQRSVVCRPIPDVVFCLVLWVHSRLHVEIMHLLSPRWPGGRSWLTEGVGSVHQRRSTSAWAEVTASGAGRLYAEQNFVRSAPLGCIKVPSGASKSGIPA